MRLTETAPRKLIKWVREYYCYPMDDVPWREFLVKGAVTYLFLISTMIGIIVIQAGSIVFKHPRHILLIPTALFLKIILFDSLPWAMGKLFQTRLLINLRKKIHGGIQPGKVSTSANVQGALHIFFSTFIRTFYIGLIFMVAIPIAVNTAQLIKSHEARRAELCGRGRNCIDGVDRISGKKSNISCPKLLENCKPSPIF